LNKHAIPPPLLYGSGSKSFYKISGKLPPLYIRDYDSYFFKGNLKKLQKVSVLSRHFCIKKLLIVDQKKGLK